MNRELDGRVAVHVHLEITAALGLGPAVGRRRRAVDQFLVLHDGLSIGGGAGHDGCIRASAGRGPGEPNGHGAACAVGIQFPARHGNVPVEAPATVEHDA